MLAPVEPRPEEKGAVQEALQRVVSSAGFSRNERQSRFLRFLVDRSLEGREGELKESVIAVEVFGRDADYDPKLDAIVRTEAIRLRTRLEKYYAGAGSSDPLIIDLPKGGYRPVFRERTAGLAVERPTSGHPRWVVTGLAMAAVLSVGVLFVWRIRTHPAPVTIAVLPLENISHDPGSEFLADGLTDEIINSLSLIDGLTVRSRTSTFSLKGKRASGTEAGRELSADYLVEGSVLHAGDQLRVTAELVRVQDDASIWTNQFDRKLTDVLAIQDEIARGIVNSLRLKLGPGRRRYETNLDAYESYLRGRQAMESFPAPGRPIARGAIRYFEEAIQKDSNYALAYAGMADALLAMEKNMGQRAQPDSLARARAAAEKAVQLDPMLSEAQSALASVQARDYAWQEAERGYRRAIELNPNNALAHLELGFVLLLSQGRLDEGIAEVRRAASLDPLSPYVNTELGRALLLAGRYQDAIDQFDKTIPLDRARPRAYSLKARALSLEGRPVEALTLDEQNRARIGPNADQSERTCAAVQVGRQEDALKSLDDNLQHRLGSLEMARSYACLGDPDRALEYLEKMFADHEATLPEALSDPEFASLRSNPRFVALRRKLNLVP